MYEIGEAYAAPPLRMNRSARTTGKTVSWLTSFGIAELALAG